MPPPTGLLSCNLCWEPLKPPFIVTSCQHAFCEKHAREPNFDESTCPGCRSHVSRVGGGGGMRSTSYVLNESDQDVLNGTTPEVAIGVALNAVQFWVSQERNRSDYAWYKMKRLQKGKDDQKQQFQQAYEQCVHELEREREARQQTEAAQEELRQEMQHLKQKYQEEARKVHAMQETIISLKRKRQDASSTMNSPLHPDLNYRPPGDAFGMGSQSGPIPSPRHNGGYDAQPPPSSFNQSVFNRSPMHPAMSRIGTPLRSSSTTPRFSSGLGPLNSSGSGPRIISASGRRPSSTPSLFGK